MEKKVIYYHNTKGVKPVKDFIDKLEVNTKAKVMARIQFLGEKWTELRRPYVAHLGDQLYELRVHFSSNNVRIIYAYMFKDYIILLHGIIKKSSKIPETALLKAKKRKIDFQIQYEEGRIKLPKIHN